MIPSGRPMRTYIKRRYPHEKLVLALSMVLSLCSVAVGEGETKEVKTFRIVCPAGGDSNPPASEWWIWQNTAFVESISMIRFKV